MKALRKTHKIRRTCSALLVMALIIGQCLTVSADELGLDIISTSLSAEEDAAVISDGTFDAVEDEAVADDLPAEAVTSGDISELNDSGNVLISESADEQTPGDIITETPDSTIGEQSETEEPLSANKIVYGDFEYSRYPSRLVITNKETVSADGGNDMYAVLIYADKTKQGTMGKSGVRIAPGESESVYTVFNKEGDIEPLDEKSEYILLLGRGYKYVDDEGNVTYGSFIFYDPENAEECENIEYKQNIPATGILSDNKIPWNDGYSGIKLSASIQKNMKIKFKWTPDKKNAEQKEYKKYELYELTRDDSYETGYKETKRWGKAASKSATLNPGLDKNTKKINSSLLYLLKCYDKSDKLVAQYATVVAPYLLEMQSGGYSGNFDYTITEIKDDPTMFCSFELATKKKGQSEWSVTYSGSDMSYSSMEYPVSSKLTTMAVEMEYAKSEPAAELGKTYFGMVQSIAYVGGLRLISAPSNVLSCKVGPDKCYIIDFAGVIYDKADAKNGNTANTERANKHLESYFVGTSGEFPVSGNDIYLHEDNTGTCAKSGMVFFIRPDDESNIKAYELLRADKPNGKYKKIKRYALNSKQLLDCTVKGFDEIKVRAMQYTNFPPEKEYYYAVRAIAKKGNAASGRGWGIENHSEIDKVQIFDKGIDKSPTAIEIGWMHDDCVKQYWIYKSESSFGDITEAKGNPIARVSARSFKKFKDPDTGLYYNYHLYTDKKVVTDKKYYYYIRPIYNTKEAAKNNKYNMDKASNEIIGKATAKFSQIKNFKAANHSVGSIKLSFSSQKGLTKYRIFRLEVDKNEASKITGSLMPDLSKARESGESEDAFEERLSGWTLDQWKTFLQNQKVGNGNYWIFVDEVTGSGKTLQTLDNYVDVGHYYFYLIQGATNESSGLIFTYTERIHNVPLPVENLKTEYEGSDANIKISWSMNSRDRYSAKYGNLHYEINYGWGWKDIDKKTTYVDRGLSRGNERTYKVRVVYQDGSTWVASKEVEKTCSLPTKINVSDSSITLKVGQDGKISASAVRDNGQNATINNIDFSSSSGNIEIKKEGNSCKIKAKSVGEATIRCSCAGISRDVKVKITQ